MKSISYTLNHNDLGIITNRDITINPLLSLYKVHKAGSSHGQGLFARRNIFKDEEIIRASGPIINSQVSETLYWSYGIDVAIQIGKDKYILPNNESRFINHSCDPNMGFRGSGIFVAMKDINLGDELTFDYSICDIGEDWVIDCRCMRISCRKKISGKDIFNTNFKLAIKYKGYIPKFVLQYMKKG